MPVPKIEESIFHATALSLKSPKNLADFAPLILRISLGDQEASTLMFLSQKEPDLPVRAWPDLYRQGTKLRTEHRFCSSSYVNVNCPRQGVNVYVPET